MPLADGTTFADYTIIRKLGTGGMGEVYLARHPHLPRQEALKVLLPEVSADKEYRERFHREADIAASLWHAHIVEVHDTGEFDGQLWLSMDFVDGTDAESLLGDRYLAGLPAAEVVKIITAIAEALDYAHSKNLLHRDVKPANILIASPGTPDERIMLADFGIARRTDDTSKLTATNMTVGTVLYAAPEQLMGTPLDGRADQYALAATAFHLLTGTPPFQHSNPAVVISQHLTASPPAIGDRRSDLAPLDEALSKAMAKEPRDRFSHCVDFAHALSHQLDAADDPSATRPFAVAAAPTSKHNSGRHERAAVKRSRPRPGVVIVAVLAVLLIAAIAVAVFETRRADDESTEIPTATTSARAVSSPPESAPPAPPPPVLETTTSTEASTATEPTTTTEFTTTTTTTTTPTSTATSTTASPVAPPESNPQG
jgi:serine/threonine-protein kinase